MNDTSKLEIEGNLTLSEVAELVTYGLIANPRIVGEKGHYQILCMVRFQMASVTDQTPKSTLKRADKFNGKWVSLRTQRFPVIKTYSSIDGAVGDARRLGLPSIEVEIDTVA